MEPGHEDREYILSEVGSGSSHFTPQWSPVMKTGNTRPPRVVKGDCDVPQWSPVMKTGNTRFDGTVTWKTVMPQWSPVMKTGNTRNDPIDLAVQLRLNGARS